MRRTGRGLNQHLWSGTGQVFGQPPSSDPLGPSRQVSRDPSLVQLLLGVAGLLLIGAVAVGIWHP